MDGKYRVAVCDDEQVHLDKIKQMAEEILQTNGCSHCLYAYSSEKELLDAMKNIPCAFDLILLDILLGERDGVDVARELREKGCASTIIFVTVTPDFATKGYEVDAHRYLLKPVKREEMERAILSDYQRKRANKRVTFRQGNRVRRVETKDIRYIETKGRGVTIHLASDEFFVPGRISDIEEVLSSAILVRCHKSYIVNIMYIERISRSEVSLQAEPFIPVGRKYYEGVKRTLMDYLAR